MQLLLKYLPVDSATWPELLKRKHQDYANFCEVSLIKLDTQSALFKI